MRVHNPNFAGVEDDALVCLAQDGDNDAFAELIERHLSTCKRLAMSILRDKQNAEDEVQNACWKAFEHINQFNKDAKFSTWLSRIVVNQCLMRLRKDRRARFLYLDDGVQGEELATLDLPDETPTPEAALAQTEIGRIIDQEVRRIPPLLRRSSSSAMSANFRCRMSLNSSASPSPPPSPASCAPASNFAADSNGTPDALASPPSRPDARPPAWYIEAIRESGLPFLSCHSIPSAGNDLP